MTSLRSIITLLFVKRFCINTFILFLFIAYSGCYNFQHNGVWKSKYHNISIEYKDPMKILAYKLDMKDKLLIGCFDTKEEQGYIIKIDKDVPLSQLTDEVYYSAIKQTMLNENQENQFIYESDTIFHGQQYHTLVFFMNTKKGERKVHCNILRQNGYMYSVQILYPCEKVKILTEKIPVNLIKLDKLIKINEI